MSIKAMSWAMNDAPVEKSGQAHVLLVLADHSGDDGRGAFPSVDTICWKTRLSRSAVQGHLRGLEKDGLIRKGNQALAAHYIERADQRPTVYDLDLTRSRGPRPERGAVLTPRSSERGPDSAPRDSAPQTNGAQNLHERGPDSGPEPSFEPSGKKTYPPTPHDETSGVADAPGGSPEELQEKDAAAGDEGYLAAVAEITSHMQWQPQGATRRKLADILKTLVPDPLQLPDVLVRSSGWISRPDKLGSAAFRGRVRALKKQIDTGVTPLHRRGLTRHEASPYGHEHVTTLEEIQTTGGWGTA